MLPSECRIMTESRKQQDKCSTARLHDCGSKAREQHCLGLGVGSG